MKAEERPRCTQYFALRQKGKGLESDVLTRCLNDEGHKGSHKARKPGGVVRWKNRRRPAEASNDAIIKAAAVLADSPDIKKIMRKHSSGRTGKKPHGAEAYRLDRK